MVCELQQNGSAQRVAEFGMQAVVVVALTACRRKEDVPGVSDTAECLEQSAGPPRYLLEQAGRPTASSCHAKGTSSEAFGLNFHCWFFPIVPDVSRVVLVHEEG